jgi:hypothetical protein
MVFIHPRGFEIPELPPSCFLVLNDQINKASHNHTLLATHAHAMLSRIRCLRSRQKLPQLAHRSLRKILLLLLLQIRTQRHLGCCLAAAKAAASAIFICTQAKKMAHSNRDAHHGAPMHRNGTGAPKVRQKLAPVHRPRFCPAASTTVKAVMCGMLLSCVGCSVWRV